MVVVVAVVVVGAQLSLDVRLCAPHDLRNMRDGERDTNGTDTLAASSMVRGSTASTTAFTAAVVAAVDVVGMAAVAALPVDVDAAVDVFVVVVFVASVLAAVAVSAGACFWKRLSRRGRRCSLERGTTAAAVRESTEDGVESMDEGEGTVGTGGKRRPTARGRKRVFVVAPPAATAAVVVVVVVELVTVVRGSGDVGRSRCSLPRW